MDEEFNFTTFKYLEKFSDLTPLYIKHKYNDFFLSSLSRFNDIFNFILKNKYPPLHVISNELYNDSYHNPKSANFQIDNTFLYFQDYRDVDFDLSKDILQHLPTNIDNLTPFKIHSKIIHYILYKFFSPSFSLLSTCNKLLKIWKHNNHTYKSSCILPIFSCYLNVNKNYLTQIRSDVKAFSSSFPSVYIFVVSDCLYKDNIKTVFSGIPNIVFFDLNAYKLTQDIYILSTVIVASKFKHCIIKHTPILNVWIFFYKHLYHNNYFNTKTNTDSSVTHVHSNLLSDFDIKQHFYLLESQVSDIHDFLLKDNTSC